MTEKQILGWIKTNLSPIIENAFKQVNSSFKADLLAAMAMREVNFLIARNASKPFQQVCNLMKGDYGQRAGDEMKCYHGFSFWQIDIGSFPDFIKSGDWQDPLKSCIKAIQVLEGKRSYLAARFPQLPPNELERASVAAYNTGEGNVSKSIKLNRDVDYTTHQKNYSKEVYRYKDIFNSLP